MWCFVSRNTYVGACIDTVGVNTADMVVTLMVLMLLLGCGDARLPPHVARLLTISCGGLAHC